MKTRKTKVVFILTLGIMATTAMTSPAQEKKPTQPVAYYPVPPNQATDSPGMSYAPVTDEATVSDGFVMYVMFKPVGDSIYLPIRQLSWRWAGRSLFGQNGWALDDNATVLWIDPNGDTEPPELPEWNDNTDWFKDTWIPE